MRGTDRLLCTGRRSTAARTRETSEDIKATGLITVWHDRNISAGTEWEHEINTQLNAAQIVLMLVSPDFMASDYCYGARPDC